MYNKEYMKEYYQKNKTRILQDRKEYGNKNRKEILEKKRIYSATHKEDRKEYLKKYKKENRRTILNTDMKRHYGVGIEAYDYFFNKQNGLCAICGLPPGKKGFHIDHDHKTGKIRGLLCVCCNLGLGGFRDNPNILQNAIKYLEKDENSLP